MKAETVIRCIVIWALVWGGSLCLAKETTSPSISLIPWPRELQGTDGKLTLTRDARIIYVSDQLRPLAEILRQELYQVTGMNLTVATGLARRGDIVLKINAERERETHTVRVDNRVEIAGSNDKNTPCPMARFDRATVHSGRRLPVMMHLNDKHSTASSTRLFCRRNFQGKGVVTGSGHRE